MKHREAVRSGVRLVPRVSANRMPFLQLRDSRYPLVPGESSVGCGPGVDVKLPGPGDGNAIALLMVSPEGAATVRRSEGQAVFVNGVAIGAEPSPLLHGDHLVVDGCEVRYADESVLGDTMELPISDESAEPAPPRLRPTEARSGGRLLSLVDGREYSVGPTGLSIGRDAMCDIVIAASDISRRHAEIRLTPSGYVLLDRSANGVLVNGRKVWVEVTLSRGDMIRAGGEEYRFYDEAAVAAPGQRAAIPAAAMRPSLQPTGTVPKLDLPDGTAAPLRAPADAPRARAAIATLEIINEGPTKGKRLEILAPVANIGRGEHNDIVIPDESVSEYHAKLHRRDDAWYVVDMESTNGTYVNGTRLAGESRIGIGADVRFGGVKTIFRPAGGAMRVSGATRVIVGVKGSEPKRLERQASEVASQPAQVAGRSARPSRTMVLLLLLLGALLAYIANLVMTRGGGS